jgi:hypothetical protein
MMKLALRSILVHTSKEYLTCRKILRHGADGFTSRPNEGVLRIFIALHNPSFSAGFELANVGSNDKHAIHYTIEDDKCFSHATVDWGSITKGSDDGILKFFILLLF